MGDRATFAFQQSNKDIIYLYGHWAGHEMMDRLARAIDTAQSRWSDEPYATRIAISQIVGEEWNQELSWGISTYFCDTEHSVPLVNWSEQTVSLIPVPKYGSTFQITAEPKFVMGFGSFINKFTKALTSV